MKSNSFARNKKITVMKKRMLLAAICSVILSVGIANAQPREGRSSGHTRSEIHHSPAPAPKPIAKVNHKPAPAPRVAYVASPVATAATVAGVAVVAGLLGAAIASR